MLKLADFFHLPEVDALVARVIADEPGLILVTGLDSRPTDGDTVIASGRATVFRILMREIMAADPDTRALVVTQDRETVRVPRALKRQVAFAVIRPPHTYAGQIAEAAHQRPDLLVIDQLSEENVPAVLDAVQQGVRVLSQLDTVYMGPGVARHLTELGAAPDQLSVLSWVVAVQRLARLCPHCRQPVEPTPAELDQLRERYPDAAPGPFFRSEGCAGCRYTGRLGEVLVFDIASLRHPEWVLPMDRYVLQLAQAGYLALDDVLAFEVDQVQRTYHLLVASEHALADTNAVLQRKVAELQAANQVLEQRTQALITLQNIGQSLITSTDLDELSSLICRRACDLCGADRAILYGLRDETGARVLAVSGWDLTTLLPQVEAQEVLATVRGPDPLPFYRWPPGVSPDASITLRAGLAVPLLAQERLVGVMIVQTSARRRFQPGEVALLQTFAHQAALAIQRTGLIEQLWAKIELLEAAQAELARKERIEHELELARQVQQSMLPRTFPQVAGFRFAARSEPARQVGGDFYDVIRLDADRFGIAIADVSGKGMPAALYMALTRSLLLAESRRDPSPRAVVRSVNTLLMELGEPNMFVTLFYGVMDCPARRFTYARAGHDRPLLLRGNSVQVLSGQGMTLGLFESSRWELSEEQITLQPGDCLVLYTDGLTDVVDPDGTLYDLAQFTALVESLVGLEPEAFCAAIFEHLHAYRRTAEQFDDMTLLTLAVD
jgi:serine phosphatase RsbU (regulator of sigma subunit)